MRGPVSLFLVIALAAGCRRARPGSEDFKAAFQLYTQLYAAELDDAYADPRMLEVRALLESVDPAAAQASEAKELLSKVNQGIAEARARSAQLEQSLKASNTPIAWAAKRPSPAASAFAQEVAPPPRSPGGDNEGPGPAVNAPAAALDASDFDPSHPGTISVKAENETLDADVVPLVAAAAQLALPALGQWGGLRHNTLISIISNRDSLQIRTHGEGKEWIAGAARYDTVSLLSPHKMASSGTLPSAEGLSQLLTHELTHCVMQQMAGTPSDYGSRRMPFWFSEGMATNTAREGNYELSRAALAAELSGRLAINPLREARDLSHGEPKLVYSTAYWSFSLLEQRGLVPIQQLLLTMHAGASFADAFGRVYGESQTAFEERLLRALRRNEPLR